MQEAAEAEATRLNIVVSDIFEDEDPAPARIDSDILDLTGAGIKVPVGDAASEPPNIRSRRQRVTD